MAEKTAFTTFVEAIETQFNADVVALFGSFDRGVTDARFVKACRERRRRPNVFLLLETLGGDPSAAYRIARCFQHAYSTGYQKSGAGAEKSPGRFDVAVSSICKSAGTLLTLGADRLFMGADAELGPIDIQLRKPDEVGERTSGLTPLQALDTLKTQSLSLFKHHFRQLRFDDQLVFSTKTAAEVATNLTVGLMESVYGQIDPMRLAEVERAIRISGEYAERIARNLKEDGLARLLGNYPSHGFVIDAKEAREIFVTVEDLPAPVEGLMDLLRTFASDFVENEHGPYVGYFSVEPPIEAEPNEPKDSGEGDAAEGGGNKEIRGSDGAGQEPA